MKYLLVLSIGLLSVFSVFAAPIADSDQAVRTAVAALLPQGSDEVSIMVWGPLSAGTEIRGTKEMALTAPADGYAVYIDLYPAANLFHAVQYAFVASASGEVTAVNASSPPQNYQDYRLFETVISRKLMAAENRRAPIPTVGSNPPTRGECFAVLMNGGYNNGNNHVRYWNDLQNIYVTIQYTYNFPENNIFVLCSDGLNPAPDQSNGQNSNPDFDNDGDADIMYPCLLNAVDAVFDSLAGLLTAGDKLFIFTTDHGSGTGGWDVVENLWNQQELTDAHFAELLAALPDCEIIFTLEPCYSGGFLDNAVFPPGPIIGSSACAYNQNSWAMGPNYVYDTYVFHWTAAVKGEDAYGVQVDADYNNNGIVTMDEAFRYAVEHDFENEDPQYDDIPNGIGQGVSLWPTGNGPYLCLAETAIDDIGGNNNGAADPGETVSVTLTLSNVGNAEATNISGFLTTVDPNLTITQNTALFPNLASFQQGTGIPDYIIDIAAGCPQGYVAACNLHLTADSNYVDDVTVSFVVGDIINSPTGPDDYGYLAYDPFDAPELPQYQWIEISPDSGGLGTEVPFVNDDQVFQYALPFDYKYYGVTYDSVSISTDGWVGMGYITSTDHTNSAIPTADGPPSMIAPFWEDLSPQRHNSGGVWQWYDALNHLFIVEYNHVEQYTPVGNFETFQIILYDPTFYPTVSNDGIIKMQFKAVSVSIQNECTLGIEDPSETDGIQYLYNGAYDEKAHTITNEFCLLFLPSLPPPALMVTAEPTTTPIVIPPGGGAFTFTGEVLNAGAVPADFDVWSLVTLPAGSQYGPLLLRLNVSLTPQQSLARDLTQNVPGGAPAGTYTYTLYAGNYATGAIITSDFFTFEKSAVDASGNVNDWNISGWDNEPVNSVTLPAFFHFSAASPNPFNPTTELTYSLNGSTVVDLVIYDIQGREVARLVEGMQSAGSHTVTFDASALSSGIYFARLTVDGQTASQKLLFLK